MSVLCKDCVFSVDVSALGAMPIECRFSPCFEYKNRDDWCGQGKPKVFEQTHCDRCSEAIVGMSHAGEVRALCEKCAKLKRKKGKA